jgi:hypothetical protein
MHAVIPALVAMANLPKVVVIGCSNTTYPLPGGVATVTITDGGAYTVAPTGVVFANPAGYAAGANAVGTIGYASGAVTGVTVTTPGIGYIIGGPVTFTGGTFTRAATGVIATLANTAPAYGTTADQTAAVMDGITKQECDLAGPNVLFVPLRSHLNPSLIQTGGQAKHPTIPAGMQAICDLVTYALDSGT